MTESASRRRPWSPLLLAAALILSSGLGAVAVGQDDQAQATEETAAEASAEPTTTAEPTPYPEFDPTSVTLRLPLFAEGFDEPVYVTDDGYAESVCLYVVERAGVVKIVAPNGAARARPFLDISRLVESGNPEQGLHSIAFHPDFARNGRFFVHYNDKNDAAVIAEFKGKPCTPYAKNGNKPVRTLYTIGQDYPNNNAGWIGFGPDGKLYIPVGDGGGAAPGDPNGVGQTPGARLSKVLRVDVNRQDLIAVDNPYVKKKKNGKLKRKGGFARETWAWGLRDPRQASFDRETGDFWIGDVGQEVGEVDLVRAGSVTKQSGAPNFGWSHVEGDSSCHPVNAPDCDPSEYVAPVYFYDQVAPHRAITGGYVYRGEAIPELQGVYLFSDLRSGYIWGLDAEAVYDGADVTPHQLLDSPQGIVSFGEGDDGELYLVALNGSIFRLDAEGR